MLAAYRHYLGEDAEIQTTYVDQIPIQASGKFMVCENKWDGKTKVMEGSRQNETESI